MSILKYMLSEALMEKAVIISTEEQKQAMLAELGPEHVPRTHGGTSDAPTRELPLGLRMPADGWSSLIEAWRPEEILIKARCVHKEVRSLPQGACLRWQW